MRLPFLLALAIAGLGGLLLFLFLPRSSPPSTAAPAPTTFAPVETQPDTPPTLDSVYGLNGLPARRIAKPDPAVREAALRKANMWHDDDPNGPHSLVIEWRDDGPWLRTCNWGSLPSPGMPLDSLVGQFLGYPDRLIDGDNRLRHLPIPGDFVFDNRASTADRIAALERFVWEGRQVRISLRAVDVNEKTFALTGHWNYQPIPDRPWATPTPGMPVIEIYGALLDPKPEGRTSYAEGTPADFARALSNYAQNSTTLDATNLPPKIRWFYNYQGDSLVERSAHNRDPALTLQNAAAQTGLRVEERTTTVRRLRIAESTGDLLP